MHDQPTDFASPRPASLSVGDYYENAFKTIFLRLTKDAIAGDVRRPLSWDEKALLEMLRDLSQVRAERSGHHARVLEESVADCAKIGPDFSDRMDLVAAKAEMIAGLNTLLHWGWVADEQLVSIGASLLDQVTLLDENGGSTDEIV